MNGYVLPCVLATVTPPPGSLGSFGAFCDQELAVRQHVQRHRSEPHDEARLVQADDRPLRPVEQEQRAAGREEDDRRDDGDRSHDYTERDVRDGCAPG